MFIANTPLGRRGQPEDIAKLPYFLLPMMLPGLRESKFPFRVACMVFKIFKPQ
jgi:hypothetical protein